MNQKPFIRIQVDASHPQSNIYITTKNFLKPKDQLHKRQKLQQLAMMDIIAIINMEDEEIFYDEIPQLNPTKEHDWEYLFQKAQGPVKLIDDVLKCSQKSVAICCNQSLEDSHFVMVCYMIYIKFNLLTDIKQLDSLDNKLCCLDFEQKNLSIITNNTNIFYEFYGEQIRKNYRFRINTKQIQEAEKFQQTKYFSYLPFIRKPQRLGYFCDILPKDDENQKQTISIHQITQSLLLIYVRYKKRCNLKYSLIQFYKNKEMILSKKYQQQNNNIFLYIVESEFVNPFENLEKTTTIEQIEETIQTLKSLNINAIINCFDNDQSLKPYGIQYLNIHINFQDQLESSRLFLHFWTKIRKSSAAIYCDSSMQKSIKVLKNYLKSLYNWNEQRVQKEIQDQNIQKEINFPQPIMKIISSQYLDSQMMDSNNESKDKLNIDWNKVYGSEIITKKDNFIRSRFVQSQILQNQ